MSTREEQDHRDVLFEEARAIFESSRVEFEALQKAVRKTVDEGRVLTGDLLREEEKARKRLFLARVRLAKRLRKKK